jgi:beta-lactamase regulating signal transducer with metallopeptidase domain
MSGPTELAIAAGVVLDAGLKATLVLGASWIGTRCLRGGSAAQRHAVWAAGFAALPVLAVFAARRGPEIAVDAPWLVGVWAVGALVSLVPLALGLVRLGRLKSTAIRDRAAPNLLHSDRVSGPLTWGLVRPVILLPHAAEGWPPAQRAAAMAHERAHIRRRDWAVHLAVWCICALFWFHPLAWLARRALAQEAEHAADDAVLAEGVRPSDYASLLITLAHPSARSVALGMGASSIGQRVRAVLGPRSRSPRRWPAWLVAAALLSLALPALGAWPTWTAAESSLHCQPGPDLAP